MSLHFTGVRLTNFLPFRGEHQVDLGPGVFALVAERDGDSRRSNAQGKSALLWALRFALTGDHPRRTEDEWITDGEREGGVDVELSDGTFVSRWRARGDATRLKIVAHDRELHGDEAQKMIDKLIGLSKDEQAATWWCEQGRADALVNGDPGEMTATVVEWCGIEPVCRAAKFVSDELAQLLKEQARHLAVEEAARREEDELAARLPPDLEAWRAPRLENLARLRRLVGEHATEEAKRAERRRLLDEAARYRELDRERRSLEAIAKPDEEEARAARAAFLTFNSEQAVVRGEVASRARLARGEFDGVCPVGGIACPAKDQLNADAKRARELLAEARGRLKVLDQRAASAEVRVEQVGDAFAAYNDAQRRLSKLRVECDRLRPSFDAAEALEATPDAAGPCAAIPVESAERELSDMAALAARHEGAARRRVDAEGKRVALEPALAARREALQILGPSGAQRRLVEGFLLEVEGDANADLEEAGVDVRVTCEWERELAQPASTCSTCGQPFPASTKVRACEHCGAPRGRKVEQKLRFLVAPKSGGMDALAGVGCRLAALAWLKSRRSSAWAVACLDEPLAAVDAHHRMLVGRHLVAMLGARFGVEQAFVSAHDPALLAALPRRIVVKGSERGSTLEVVT